MVQKSCRGTFERLLERIRSPYLDGYNNHTDKVALIISKTIYTTLKPQPDGYPTSLETLGDYIRKERLERGLLQVEVAKVIGVTTDTITNWELNRNTPQIAKVSAIVGFLGYDPFVIQGDSLIDKIVNYSRKHGVSYKQLARVIGADEGAFMRIIYGKSKPIQRTIQKIEDLILETDAT